LRAALERFFVARVDMRGSGFDAHAYAPALAEIVRCSSLLPAP
jgi:hypothetical protein